MRFSCKGAAEGNGQWKRAEPWLGDTGACPELGAQRQPGSGPFSGSLTEALTHQAFKQMESELN